MLVMFMANGKQEVVQIGHDKLEFYGQQEREEQNYTHL